MTIGGDTHVWGARIKKSPLSLRVRILNKFLKYQNYNKKGR